MRAGPAFCRAGLGSSAQWESPVWPSRSRRWPSRSLEGDLPSGAGRRVCRGGCGARGPTGKRPDHGYRALKQPCAGHLSRTLMLNWLWRRACRGNARPLSISTRGLAEFFRKAGSGVSGPSGPGRLGRINPDIKWGTAAAQRQRRHLGKTGHRRVWRPFGTGPRDK